ncbi:MAG: diguanylate cyclase, partial [Pseudomonadales bacterium]|nr:diguanylate cyclase [Pseudomonadales bacterium]
SIICEQSPAQTSRALWPLLQQGLVLPLNENYKFSDAPDRLILTQYQFLHDRVQQAAYTLINHEQRPSVMLNAGRLLLASMDKMPQVVQEKHLFTILGLINDSYHLITDAVEKVQLLELNIRGGVKARNASAFPAAINFFSVAKAMLPENVWQEEPEQALLVYQALTESLYLAGEFDAADALYPVAIRVANNALAKVSLMLIQATQYQQQARFTEALTVLVEGLALLGFDFPSLEGQAEVLLPEFFLMTLQNLNSHSEQHMLGMAEMTEPHYLQAMELHNVLTVVLYQLRMFNTYAVNSCQMLKLSFDHGHCDLTPLAYLTSAWAMSMMGEPYTRCYEVGRLSLTLVDQRENRYHRVLIYQGFSAFFQHWGEPLENTLPLLEKAVRWGQEGLDFTSAGYAVLLGGVNKFICGVKLRTLEIDAPSGLAFLRRSHQVATANFVEFSTLQPALALQGKTLHPMSFDTKSVDVTVFFDGDYTTPSMELALFSQAMIRHAFIMKARVEQQRFIQNLPVIEACLPHSPSFSESLFFTTLILIESIALTDAAASQSGDKNSYHDIEEKRALVKEYACRFKQWSDGCPETYRHKYLMIEAEIASLVGDGSRAMDCYALAIEDAKEMGFIQCEAIANELYAQYWLQNGQKQIAVHLIREAYYLYQCWGAKVKCDLLESHWPYVSFALEERVQAYGNPLKIVSTVTQQADVLDLHSLLKANQLLSEELGLESLLRRMMEVLLENSGAEKCGIIVLDEWKLVVEMIGKFDNKSQELDCQRYGKTLQCVCTGDVPLLPDALIHHVHKTLSTLVLTRPIKDPYFSYNTYFQQYDPKSVMCLPILYQGNLIAVIYLENNLMEGAFTTRHKETLTLLSTQLAISLINAMLYDKMEMKVALRTEELRQIAMKDGLTNIANRRSFDERLQGEWRRSLRNGKPLSLLMIDIDFFKQYNDSYGHLLGDECIKAVARTLSLSAPRAMDFVARYGGEEFCVLLSESDQDMALLVALTCLDAIRGLALPHKQSSVESYVTISVGVSTLVADPNMTPCALMANADEALYRAKNNGRNCVIVHEGT